jgi:hypothetical protein
MRRSSAGRSRVSAGDPRRFAVALADLLTRLPQVNWALPGADRWNGSRADFHRPGPSQRATTPIHERCHRSAMSAPRAKPAAASHSRVGNIRHHIAPPQPV